MVHSGATISPVPQHPAGGDPAPEDLPNPFVSLDLKRREPNPTPTQSGMFTQMRGAAC